MSSVEKSNTPVTFHLHQSERDLGLKKNVCRGARSGGGGEKILILQNKQSEPGLWFENKKAWTLFVSIAFPNQSSISSNLIQGRFFWYGQVFYE